MCWNMRSLLPKFAEFEIIIDKTSPDLVCICESWLSDSVSNSQIEVNGYTLFRHDRFAWKKGGGLCIFGRDHLKLDATRLSHLNVSNATIEIQVLKLQLPCTKPLIFLNTYRPPNGNITQAIEKIQFVIDSVPSSSELYILGDLNIDLLASRSTSAQKLKLFGNANEFIPDD